MLLFALALSPAIAVVWFLYARNVYRPESKALLTALFVLGGASALIALVLNHTVERYSALWAGAQDPLHQVLFWLLGTGLNEEFAKALVLLVLLYPRRSFRMPYQGLLGAATVAVGFAAVENLFYLQRYGTPTLLIRSVLTVPAHACFTVPLGVSMAYAKRSGHALRAYLWLVLGLSTALSLHGLYDIWLSFEQVWLNRMAYLQVLLMLLLVLRLMRLQERPVEEPGA